MAWLGRLLYNIRGHDWNLLNSDPALAATPNTLVVTSDDFTHNSSLPASAGHTRAGRENISPHLAWSNLPEGTQEIVLVMQDPDPPVPSLVITHTVVLGINPSSTSFAKGVLTIPVGQQPPTEPHADGWIFGRAMMNKRGYWGPNPPRGHGSHRYLFYFYALKGKLPAEAKDWPAAQLGKEMAPLVLARGEIIGTYEAQQTDKQ